MSDVFDGATMHADRSRFGGRNGRLLRVASSASKT